jgi:hypothetical protein
MKIIRLAIVCLLTSLNFAYGQTISGIVKDSLGQSLPLVSIYIRDQSDILSYSSTDAKGHFNLIYSNIEHRTGLIIEASSIGFEKKSVAYDPKQRIYNFILKTSFNQLQTVVVKDNRPRLKVKGDTTTYSVADFESKGDRVIGDVLKKLPGIEVTQDGKIYYNGKSISNFYIDGDNLLDDKYNVATRSIPKGIVDKIQVLENNQPIKMLRNKIRSNDVALNLTIKDSARIRLIGQETIGGGTPSKYYADINAMMFKKQYKAINYIKANNVGYDLLNDVFSQNLVDYLNQVDNPKPPALLSLGSSQNPMLPLNRYLMNNSGIANLNNLFNVNKSLQVKTNLYYLKHKQKLNYLSINETHLPNDTIRFSEKQSNWLNQDYLHGQLTILNDAENSYFKNTLVFNKIINKSHSLLSSNNLPLDQRLRTNVYDLSEELSYLKTLNSNNVLELYGFINSFKTPESRVIEPGINQGLFNNDIKYDQLVQDVVLPTTSLNTFASLKVLNGLIKQSFKAGYSMQSQRLQTSLSIVQLNLESLPAFDSSLNSLTWLKQRAYLESQFELSRGKFTAVLKLPISYQSINYKDPKYSLNSAIKRWLTYPSVFLKLPTGLENFISLNYDFKNEYGTIDNVYRGYILTDYRSLQAFDSPLKEEKINTISIGYNFRKSIELLFATLSLDFKSTKSNQIKTSIISDNFTKTIVLPYDNNTKEYGANFRLSKYVFFLKSTMSAGGSFRILQTNFIQNNILLPYETYIPNVFFNTETKFSEKFSLSYRGSLSFIKTELKGDIQSTSVNIFQQNASLGYYPIDNLFFSFSDDFYHNSQRNGNTLNYNFVDANVRYKIRKSGIEIELDGKNLVNIKNYTLLNISANSFTSSRFVLPGRIVLAKVVFNL